MHASPTQTSLDHNAAIFINGSLTNKVKKRKGDQFTFEVLLSVNDEIMWFL